MNELSDILFCYTDGDSFRENIYDSSVNYQNAGFMSLKPDMYGLKMWDEWQPDWENYEIVFLHLNPLIMNPPWWLFPSLIKRKIGNIPLLLSHEYFDKYVTEPFPEMFRKSFSRADGIIVDTKQSFDLLREKFGEKVIYGHFAKPVGDEMFTVKRKPWEDREGLS